MWRSIDKIYRLKTKLRQGAHPFAGFIRTIVGDGPDLLRHLHPTPQTGWSHRVALVLSLIYRSVWERKKLTWCWAWNSEKILKSLLALKKTKFNTTLLSVVLPPQARSILGEAALVRSCGFAKNNRCGIITQVVPDLQLHPISCYIWEVWIRTSARAWADIVSLDSGPLVVLQLFW